MSIYEVHGLYNHVGENVRVMATVVDLAAFINAPSSAQVFVSMRRDGDYVEMGTVSKREVHWDSVTLQGEG